jgi:glycosyltransferase involved in cell wall biosynthesis
MVPLFVSYEGLVGGGGRLLLDVAGQVQGTPLIACPPSALADRARDQGLPVALLRARRVEVRAGIRDRLAGPVRLADLVREVRSLVVRSRPDVVVAWGMRAALACATALAPSRAAPPLAFQQNDLIPGPLIGRAVRAAALRAALVMVPSHAVAQDTDPAGRLGHRVRVLPPGVDMERFTPEPLPALPPSVLVLGWLVPYKRPDLALEAVALAARELPDLHVTLAGPELPDPAGQDLVRRLQGRAAQADLAGRVTFLGPVDNPAAALAASHCLLHCADREPFGIVMLEALASGRPVVAPAGGGPVDVLDDSCGHLYTPGDGADAAAALVKILGDRTRLEALSVGARRRARDFALPGTAERAAEAITELAGRPAPSARRRLRAIQDNRR